MAKNAAVIPKRLPLGVEDFQELVDPERHYLYVDKTLMLKEFVEGTKVSLIIRPRRWGKTLNMSMLEYFFAAEAYGKLTKGLFDQCKISHYPEIMRYQGQYPVIFLTLKNIKASSFSTALEQFYIGIQSVCLQYSGTIAESQQLSKEQKERFNNLLEKTINEATLETSLKTLSNLLYTHYGQKVIILIDEYDTPLNHSYRADYLDEMTNFMKAFFGATFKTNQSLEKGLMTGILRLSKNNMLSDLNNLKIYSMFDEEYSDCFGFSGDEVNALFKQKGLEMTEQIKQWYNGYPSGKNLQVYNPVSVIECVNKKGDLNFYWLLTGDDYLIERTFLNASDEIKDKFEKLLSNESIEGLINDHVTYEDLDKDESSLWSLLLTSGYLKAVEWKRTDIYYECKLQIPNYEVGGIYRSVFKKYLINELGLENYHAFLNQLLLGEVEAFCEALGGYLLKTASLFDVGDKRGESFYHGFSLGLLAALPSREYWVLSNRESGLGRYDVCVIPKTGKVGTRGIILEFKHVKLCGDTTAIAHKALDQIRASQYDTELRGHAHLEKILEVGLAFSGKSVIGAYEEVTVKTDVRTPVKVTPEIRSVESY